MPAVLVAALSASQPAAAVSVSRSAFGRLPDGRAVEMVTFTNGHGVCLKVITLGASIQSLVLPDRGGRLGDVILGYASLEGYLAKPQYFGATVGRVANRLANGRFLLDGRTHQLPINDGPNTLHGGPMGFDKQMWRIRSAQSGPQGRATMELVSSDGDEGFPGTLTVTATYGLDEHDEVSVEYRASTDKATVVNLSNHAYFNLGGEGSSQGVMGHLLTIPAEEFTPVDSNLIPIGEFRHVAGTVFDFRTAKPIGHDIRDGHETQLLYGRGYDHNWVIGHAATKEPRLVARVEDPVSGRVMEVLSNQPGLQFYSGNFLDGTTVGKSGRTYRQADAFVLEPQQFPNTPNQPSFGSSRLEPGETYRNRILFRFSVTGH